MMLRQALASEPRALPRLAPVRPRTVSRANPAVHLPYRPRLRATPHRPSRNVRRYDWIASSGSVVANDPANKTDPTGLQEMLMFGNFEVSKAATYNSNDPNAGVKAAAKMNTEIAAGAATSFSIVGAIRFLYNKISEIVNPTKVSLSEAQQANLKRFEGKLPANAGPVSIKAGENGSVAVTATSAGKVPGSSATYSKVIDAEGKTITGSYTKTTVDPQGNIVHVKIKN